MCSWMCREDFLFMPLVSVSHLHPLMQSLKERVAEQTDSMCCNFSSRIIEHKIKNQQRAIQNTNSIFSYCILHLMNISLRGYSTATASLFNISFKRSEKRKREWQQQQQQKKGLPTENVWRHQQAQQNNIRLAHLRKVCTRRLRQLEPNSMKLHGFHHWSMLKPSGVHWSDWQLLI